jgi:hypothetical protein
VPTPLLLCLVFTLAADSEVDIQRQRQRILGLASAAAPEIQAAALLKLAESDRRLPAKQRADLAEQSFVLATQAREQYPRVRAYGAPPDTSDSYRAAASGLKLDRLSLQTRAAKLSPSLFERMEPPKLGKLGCESGTVPNLDDYYSTNPVDPLVLIGAAESPLELAAVARLVRAQEHAEALAARLASSAPDSRAFAASWESFRQSLSAITAQFPSPTLAEGIRKYILTHFNGPRCLDAGHVFQSGRAAMDWFNAAEIRGSVPALEESAFVSPKVEGRAKVENYWESEANQGLMDGIRELRFSAKGVPYNEAERESPEWKQSLNQFVSKLRAARPGFHPTAALLQALIEFTPRGPERDRLINWFLEVLRTSDAQRELPAEWLWRADSLHRMLEQSADPDLEKVQAGFRNGGVPALVLYAWGIL